MPIVAPFHPRNSYRNYDLVSIWIMQDVVKGNYGLMFIWIMQDVVKGNYGPMFIWIMQDVVKENYNLMTIVKAYSKWLDVHPIKAATSRATILKLCCTFAEHGLPNGYCDLLYQFRF